MPVCLSPNEYGRDVFAGRVYEYTRWVGLRCRRLYTDDRAEWARFCIDWPFKALVVVSGQQHATLDDAVEAAVVRIRTETPRAFWRGWLNAVWDCRQAVRRRWHYDERILSRGEAMDRISTLPHIILEALWWAGIQAEGWAESFDEPTFEPWVLDFVDFVERNDLADLFRTLAEEYICHQGEAHDEEEE